MSISVLECQVIDDVQPLVLLIMEANLIATSIFAECRESDNLTSIARWWVKMVLKAVSAHPGGAAALQFTRP